MRFALVVSAFLLSGCMVGSVSLQHPTTKQDAQCGPYFFKFGAGLAQLDRCLDDYQRQGYQRVRN